MTTAQRRALNGLVTGNFDVVAKGYDWAPLQRWVYKPAQDEMVALLRAHHSQRIVDIACGTGILAARIADEVAPDAIYGVDASDGMLAKARQRSAKVTWLTGPAERLPFADGALDAVLSTSAFHFFDQRAALDEFHRVLAPGGFAAIATLSPDRHSVPALRRVLDDRVPADTPTPEEMRTMFERAAFEVNLQRPVHRTLTVPFAMVDWITVGLKHNADVG
jgi:ubiquinone/menaquinone biosynthesis C-methylase UbiE